MKSNTAPKDNRPLCVDLDGTLVRTDTLWEVLALMIKQRFWLLFRIPLWLMQGKAFLKKKMSESVDLDVETLPYHVELLDFLRTQRAAGRKLLLCTAADVAVAQKVADHMQFFSKVIASDGRVNLSGEKKASLLVAMFGRGGFDYAGNGLVDVPVWRAAHEAIVVDAYPVLLRSVEREARVGKVFRRSGNRWEALWRSLRPYQWIKNTLVFVPLLMAHELFDVEVLMAAGLAFVAFSFCASALYLWNDLLDLAADRRHVFKNNRPLAAGTLPIWWALLAAGALLCLSFGIGSLLSSGFLLILTLYAIGSAAYSFYLKQFALLDVAFLSGLYTIRLLGGGAATDIPVSEWLLAFSVFFFMSLAIVKRFAELKNASLLGESSVRNRGYELRDMKLLATLGASSGYLSVLVLALYITSNEVTTLYSEPRMLWLICGLLLYWFSRLWLLAHRGAVHEDPILFAAKDTPSYVVGGLALLAILIAI